MALAEQFSKPTWTRYKVLLWLGGAATIAYICRNSLSVAEKGIREDLGLDAFQMGLVMGAFQISYALLQICLLYTSPSPRDKRQSRMPSSA